MKQEHQEARGTGTFPTGIYGGRASSNASCLVLEPTESAMAHD
jgi:hypothetical protein